MCLCVSLHWSFILLHNCRYVGSTPEVCVCTHVCLTPHWQHQQQRWEVNQFHLLRDAHDVWRWRGLEVHKSASHYYSPVTNNRKVTHYTSQTETLTHLLQTNVKMLFFFSLVLLSSCALAYTHEHANINKHSNSVSLSLSLSLTSWGSISSMAARTDKSVLITGESGERCHDVTNCKQIQWNKSLFVSTQWKVDRVGTTGEVKLSIR